MSSTNFFACATIAAVSDASTTRSGMVYSHGGSNSPSTSQSSSTASSPTRKQPALHRTRTMADTVAAASTFSSPTTRLHGPAATHVGGHTLRGRK